MSSDLFPSRVNDDVGDEVGSWVNNRRASEPLNSPKRVMALAAWCLLKASMKRPR